MANLGEQAGFRIRSNDVMYLLLPRQETNRVVISTHGGHTVLSKTNQFKVPTDAVLRFYSDDTFSVLDPGFSSFYNSEAAPKEIITEGEKCFDYVLTKYQGRHGNKSETYDSIAETINTAVQRKAMYERMALTAPSPEKSNDYLQRAATSKVAAVLTVRNRWFKADVTLSYVIACVKANVPSIIIFDCLFCRSTMFGGSQSVPLTTRIHTEYKPK